MVIVAQGPPFRFSCKREFIGYDNKIENVHKLQRDEEGIQEPLEVREHVGEKSQTYNPWAADHCPALALFRHRAGCGVIVGKRCWLSSGMKV